MRLDESSAGRPPDAAGAPPERPADDAILILLATYDGERFLPDLLQSLLGQSHRNWSILVRDDGSTDATRQIIGEYAAANSRIQQIRDNLGCLGPCANFATLMKIALNRPERYVAFADQDDVWKPEKLQRQLSEMKRLERLAADPTPLLVHTDLALTDAELNMQQKSIHRATSTVRQVTGGLRSFVLNNCVYGCSMLVNRPLLELASPLPAAAMMHDWWNALCAVSCGRIGYVPQSTVLYRQHGGNVVGGQSLWEIAACRLGQLVRSGSEINETFLQSVTQNQALRERLEERNLCTSETGDLLRQLVEVFDGSVDSRLARVRRLMSLRVPEAIFLRRLFAYMRAFQFTCHRPV